AGDCSPPAGKLSGERRAARQGGVVGGRSRYRTPAREWGVARVGSVHRSVPHWRPTHSRNCLRVADLAVGAVTIAMQPLGCGVVRAGVDDLLGGPLGVW